MLSTSPQPGTSRDIPNSPGSDFEEMETRENGEISNSSDSEDDYQPEKRKGRWKHGTWVLEKDGERDIAQSNDGQNEANREENSDEEEETIDVVDKVKFGKKQQYNPYLKLKLESLNHASKEALNRAEEYMKLYLLRYNTGQMLKDMARRMLFAAYLYSAPYNRIKIPINLLISGPPRLYHQPINIRRFFRAKDKLETQIGLLQWDLFYISGEHFFSDQSEKELTQNWEYFTIRLLNIIRTLHKATIRREWTMAAECIMNIPLLHRKYHQQHSAFHFEYLTRTLAPYLPSIYLTSLQCLLESKQSINELGRQFTAIFNAFMLTNSSKNSWRDHILFYYSNLLIFHLANLNLEQPKRSEEDWLMLARTRLGDIGTAEHRRVIYLLNYCIDIERYLYELNKEILRTKYNKLNKIHDRSLSNSYEYFLTKLLDEPRDALGFLPLIIWCAQQFDFLEELKDQLLEQCFQYPYLLIHVHNVLARFQLENISGYLLSQLFELSLEFLSTTNFILDLVEQRSLDPTSYGQFDSIISGNLRALFKFLDYGRNRTDERAWALLYSNICYIKENEELVNALIKPYWEKRKSWWPKFHQMERVKLPKKSAKLRKHVFEFLQQL